MGPYRKSLLYLVSRALEDVHKMPLLGLANSFSRDEDVLGRWSQKPWIREELDTWHQNMRQLRNHYALDAKQIATAAEWSRGKVKTELDRIDSAHGSFDNDVRVVSDTICRGTPASRAQGCNSEHIS